MEAVAKQIVDEVCLTLHTQINEAQLMDVFFSHQKIGHPTVIVNNAGVAQGKSILELSEKDVQQYVHSILILRTSLISTFLYPSIRTMSVNTLAHFWTLKAFLPEMIKQKTGHVVSVKKLSSRFMSGLKAERATRR